MGGVSHKRWVKNVIPVETKCKQVNKTITARCPKTNKLIKQRVKIKVIKTTVPMNCDYTEVL